ncbi:diketogulonate reductase-like aldo/keto reductase [Rhizobium sp. BK226]|jgi:2,5-diketo-D-gluconate reductase B|nr:diketogulonate reductase-like aldo/keto reductase [Rhizobium sp. BK112]MBB3371754.1 diketogulonate reductase-like aldo/keto reductase [Rhizobium sp. BK077]MBB4117598.1 diketogulonate reductase-like aldo/keto reductase [Rhizobium sp. BK226]MBB4182524.1 diketogulonate reductase-like aldo/keto reductase [Rhizobium sp. BK109]MBB4255657.1 diketogulonate reductase-like aldo/keto reductase [Rhizobium sp. BK008]
MPGDTARPVVESGLALGFRHIDTAAMYDNEAAIGAALAASGIHRADLFVTTKVWHDKLSPDALRRSFDTSLSKLRLDHIDLFLVHWPSTNMNMSTMLDAITVTAYAPLAQGRAAKDPVLARIGEKHGATAAQIAIAWLLDQACDP